MSGAAAPPPRYYTKDELLAKVKVHYRTIMRWVDEGKFPDARRHLCGVPVFLADPIDDWLVKQLATA